MEKFSLKNQNYFARIFLGLTIALAGILAAFEWRTICNYTSPPGETREEPPVFDEFPPLIILKKSGEEQPNKEKKARAHSISVQPASEFVIIKKDEKFVEAKFPDNDEEPRPLPIPDEKAPEERDIFCPVEQMPEFPGGEIELMRFLKKNIKYPDFPKRAGIEGVVYVEFIIDVDGSIKGIKILKGAYPDLDQEALRVINLMPKWKAGHQRSKPVQVGMRLPIRFNIM